MRMALGADRGNVIGMVLRGAFWQVGIGLGIGIPAAIGAGKLMNDQLFGVKPWDPVMLTRPQCCSHWRHSWHRLCRCVAPPESSRCKRCATSEGGSSQIKIKPHTRLEIVEAHTARLT